MALEFLKTGKNLISGIDSGAVNGIYAKVGFVGYAVGIALAVLVGLAVIYLFLRKMFMYNIDVYVFKKYTSGLKLLKRKGRVFKDKEGTYWFEITRNNIFDFKAKKIPIIDQSLFMDKGKGEAIFLLQTSPLDYKPLLIEPELNDNDLVAKLSIIDINASNHATQLHKQVVQRQLSKQKVMLYLPTITLIGSMIFVVVLLWITLGRIEQMNQAMTTGYQMMADAIKDFGKQIIH